MKKLTIAFDCDGVLLDYVANWLNHINDKYRVSPLLKEEDIMDFGFENIERFPIKIKEEVEKEMRLHINSGHLAELLPYNGIQETIDKLSEIAKLDVVTARFLSERDVTLETVKENFPNRFRSFYFSDNDYDLKLKYFLTNGYDFIIDDHPQVILDLAKTFIEGEKETPLPILLSRPWNNHSRFQELQELEKYNIIRIARKETEIADIIFSSSQL